MGRGRIEFRSRGRAPGPLLDAYADAIAGTCPPASLMAPILAGIGDKAGDLRKLLSNIRVYGEDR